MNTPTRNDLDKLTLPELRKLSADAFSEYYRLETRPCGDWTPGRTFPELDAATARLEAINSEIERRQSKMKNYYWTLEGWGNQNPPENADEIIEWANHSLELWGADYPDADDDMKAGFSNALWQRYCIYDDAVREIIDGGNFNAAVALMDDDIREALHAEIAPCSEYIFLFEYMIRHSAVFGEEFTINAE